MPGKKRVNRADIDEALIRDLIGGQPAMPGAEDSIPALAASGSILEPDNSPAPRQEPKPTLIPASPKPQQIKQPAPEVTPSSYRLTFLTSKKYVARATCHLAQSTHEKLGIVAQRLGGGNMSLTTLVNNILTHHLETYRDQINELIKNTTKTI